MKKKILKAIHMFIYLSKKLCNFIYKQLYTVVTPRWYKWRYNCFNTHKSGLTTHKAVSTTQKIKILKITKFRKLFLNDSYIFLDIFENTKPFLSLVRTPKVPFFCVY